MFSKKKFKSRNYYLIVFVLWFIAVVVRLRFNGLILGLDYGLYHPDGALYSTKALDWAGYSETQAAETVASWYNLHAFKFNSLLPQDLFYENHHLYKEYSTRILYSFLSIPFVKLFGVPGMLVIPSIALLVFMMVVARVGILENKRFITLVLLFFISSSTSVMRWMISNTTDALLTGVFAIVGFLLYKEKFSKYWYLIFSTLIVLSGITRFSVFFWLAISLGLWLNNLKRKSIFVVFMSVLVAIPTMLTNPGSSFLAVEGNRSIIAKILLYPAYLIKITFYEFAQLYILDRILFTIIIVALIFSLKQSRKNSSKYFLLTITAGFVNGAINGNVGINFRYQLPVLFFICWTIIDNSDIPIYSRKK